MADIGEIRARLSLDTADFNRRMSSARGELERTGVSANSTSQHMNRLQTASHLTGAAIGQNLNRNLTSTSGSLSQTGELAFLVGQSLDTVRNSSVSAGAAVADWLNAQLANSGELLNGTSDSTLTLAEYLAQLQENSQATGDTLATHLNPEVVTAEGQFNNAANSGIMFEETLTRIQIASLALGAALSVGVGATVNLAADFEQQMKNIQAVSGATEDELTKLADLAKELGASSSFSASEAAMGIEELIKAGLTVEQVMAGGLAGALELAAAGGLELADAAEIASTALNSFKADSLSVSQAADILAGAANASATDVGELKFGLSSVSAVAAGVGLNFKDTSTALALFAMNGLKGSDAGTSLKTMLLTLSPSTKEATAQMKELGLLTAKGTSAFYDANGSIKSMAEIAELLQTKLAHLSDEQRQMALKTMFGTDAIRAANILYNEGAKGIDSMWQAMSKVTAAEVAATKLDTLNGAVEEFRGAMETVGISIGEEFLPALTDIVGYVTNLVRKFGEVDGSAIKVGLAMAGTATAIALVTSTIAKLSIALRAFSLTPVGAAITALSVLGGVIAGAVLHQREMSEVTLENAEAMLKNAESFDETIQQYDALKAKSKLTTDELARFVDINSEISKTADPNVLAALRDEQVKLQEKSGLSNDELQRLVDLNGKIIETVPGSNTVLTEQGNVLLENTNAAKKYNAEQYELIRLELEAQKTKAEAGIEKYLIKEKTLLEEMRILKQDMQTLDGKEIEQRKLLTDLEEQLATAKANNDTDEINRLNFKISTEKQIHQIMKDELATQAEAILKKAEEIDKIQAQIGKLDEVKRKMIDLELKQAGINAKRGAEVTTIEQAISALEAQKRKLEETTPIAQRNSGEYQEAVTHIQNQIDNLNGVKSRILDITDAASVMNYELGKQVRKDVIIRQVEGQSLKQMPGLDYHTGGITGRGQMPTLHTGGLASKFADLPAHNEIDVRLLRNEMVLTEAQQANLMRMIDAGFTQKGADRPADKVENTEIHIAQLVVREEADVDRIADALERKKKEAKRGRGLK